MKRDDPTLPTWDTVRVRLQQSGNLRCKCAPTVRDRSKRVAKTSLPNACIQGGNSELILQYKSCYEQEEKSRTKGPVPQRAPNVFKSQNNLIILNLPFPEWYILVDVFRDQPKNQPFIQDIKMFAKSRLRLDLQVRSKIVAKPNLVSNECAKSRA